MNQRERFEAWATQPYPDLNVGRLGAGYKSPKTSAAWRGWQEAERQAIERCAKVCDGWLHADGDRCAEAIRALGAEDD